MTNQDVAAVAKSVRGLAIDAIEQAGSGHPGLPLGLAELGALLYGEFLRHNPAAPRWVNRDRFVLSAGHGSMLQYALLHMAGFDLPMEELARFRQPHSRTPGHPEYGMTDGVETTTGPLGQGFGNAVGFAVAEAHLHPQFTDADGSLIDHYTYCIASDGDLMEGVCAEAASLAGHLRLGKLIVFFDDNRITIEGDTELTVSENSEQRFAAYGWQVLSASAYDVAQVRAMVEMARAEGERPTLIRVRSVIGHGAPNKAGSADVHGAPLGGEEAAATREALGLGEAFSVDPQARRYFEARRKEQKRFYRQWQGRFEAWRGENPGQYERWRAYFEHAECDYGEGALELPGFEAGTAVATRNACGAVLQALARQLPHLIGGSADLAPSNKTGLKDVGHFSAGERSGRLLHFGLREHAMGAVVNGLSLYGAFRPFCATFLVFSDYMRPAIRLAALMGLPIIYVFSHDSIYVGEDGPTHQPVEHLAALRVIPNMRVYRPADGEETAAAWRCALRRRDGPTAIVTSRQSLPVLTKDDARWRERLFRYGAYIARRERGDLRVVALASGSEVSLVVAAAEEIDGGGGGADGADAVSGADAVGVRVVSVCCRELLERAPAWYRDELLPPGVRTVVVEAGVANGWEHYVDRGAVGADKSSVSVAVSEGGGDEDADGGDGSSVSIAASEGGGDDRPAHASDMLVMSEFGLSGPAAEVAAHYSFTVPRVVELLRGTADKR